MIGLILLTADTDTPSGGGKTYISAECESATWRVVRIVSDAVSCWRECQ